MAWLHLGRVLGMVALMGALLPVVTSFADGRPARMLVAGALMLLGLTVAVVCDRALDAALDLKLRREQKQGQDFNGAQLLVGLRWFRWLLQVAVFGGFALLFSLFAWEAWKADSLLIGALGAGVAVVFLVALVALLVLALQVMRSGHLLCVGAAGFSVAGESTVAWPVVRGLDMQYGSAGFRHAGESINRPYHLQLAVDAPSAQAAGVGAGYWPWRWNRPRLIAEGRILDLPLYLYAASPYVIEGAVRVLCKRYGERFLDQWRSAHARPDQIADLERADGENKRQEQVFVVANSVRYEDIAKLPAAERRQKIQAAMVGLKELGFLKTK
ncbi:hypothetical protein [Acidovorax sp. Root217]|uniref:hypothetical protein n=1 Tax=Acidovorax sp. Root217 TaxID=1736492 RepID=UPI0007098FCE|nr:hypothetical protein [Acidovorax sp. Root217]KRC23877.1 hypothetical protein ASE31_04660 [Acidovorax sp. Root217]